MPSRIRQSAPGSTRAAVVLDMDPFVDASQVRVSTRAGVVRLEGVVPRASERDVAMRDAWFVFGVDRVDDRIEVRSGPALGTA